MLYSLEQQNERFLHKHSFRNRCAAAPIAVMGDGQMERISLVAAKQLRRNVKHMENQHNTNAEPDMLPEYDFSGKQGVRGKYFQAPRQGHTVRITQEDGSVTTQHFTLEDGAVLLAPDVCMYFPDSDRVNQALRGLIQLIPQEQRKAI